MSSPDDDARFRPGDPTPDDYRVGEDYQSAPNHGYAAPTPYGAVETPTASPTGGTPNPPLPPGAPGSAAGYRPVPGSPGYVVGAPPSKPHRSAATRITIGAIAVVLVMVVVAFVGSRLSGDGGSGSGGTATSGGASDPTPYLDEVWSVDLEELSGPPADADFSYHPDGAFTGPQIVDGDGAWVAVWTTGEDYVNDGVIAVEPDTGAVLWERALPEVLCADQQLEGTLLCVAHEADGWVYHRIDAVTGEDQVTADLEVEQVETVHSNGEVLIAVGPASPAPHAIVTGIALDGTTLWDYDIAKLEGADLLFTSVYDSKGEPVLERPRWRDLDGGLVMLWSTPGVAIIDPTSGDTFVHECRAATPAGDHYFCQVDEDLHRYELDGTLTWTAAGTHPATPEDASDARLVALQEPVTNTFDVVEIDPETGELGDQVYRFQQRPGTWTSIVIPPSINAEPDATFLVGDAMVVALDPETGELMWSLPHDFTYAGDVMQAGDVAVFDADHLVGIDIATGVIAWERDVRGRLEPVGDDFVAFGLTELRRVALP